jgi:hypothetical protein
MNAFEKPFQAGSLSTRRVPRVVPGVLNEMLFRLAIGLAMCSLHVEGSALFRTAGLRLHETELLSQADRRCGNPGRIRKTRNGTTRRASFTPVARMETCSCWFRLVDDSTSPPIDCASTVAAACVTQCANCAKLSRLRSKRARAAVTLVSGKDPAPKIGFQASPASDRWILAGGSCDACEYLCPGDVRLCLLRPDAPSNLPTLQILAALCAWCPLSTNAHANTRTHTHAHTAHTAHTPPSTHPHLTSAPFGIPWHEFSSGIPSGMVRRPASRNVGWDAL